MVLKSGYISSSDLLGFPLVFESYDVRLSGSWFDEVCGEILPLILGGIGQDRSKCISASGGVPSLADLVGAFFVFAVINGPH